MFNRLRGKIIYDLYSASIFTVIHLYLQHNRNDCWYSVVVKEST